MTQFHNILCLKLAKGMDIIMIKRLLNLESDKNGLSTIFHIIIILLIFFLSQLVASVIVDFIWRVTRVNLSLSVTLRLIFEIGLFYLFMHFYVTKILKLNMLYFRITKPRFSFLWITIAFLLPLAVISYYFIFTNGTISYVSSESILLYIAYALKRGLTAGITEEFLFRGFIMKLVERRWNKKIAIILPSIIFTSFHLIKGMGSIDIILLFIAGITVSVMFSLVTYLNENIWDAVIIHIIWNTLILGIFHISPQNDFQNLVNYIFDSNNILITGGRFGIESGIPAIMGFTVIIIIVSVLLRKNQQHISRKGDRELVRN